MKISRRGFGLLTGSSAVAVAANAHAQIPTALDVNDHIVSLSASGDKAFSFTRLRFGVQFYVNGITKSLIFYSPSVVRVNANLGKNHWTNKSIVIIDRPKTIDFRIKDTGGTLLVTTSKLQIAVDKGTGALTFSDLNGKVFTQESATNPQTIKKVELQGTPSYEVENTLTLKAGEGIYGFGYVNEAILNRRNQDLLLVQTELPRVCRRRIGKNYAAIFRLSSAL